MKRKRVVATLVEPRRFDLQEEEVEVSPAQVWVRIGACGICHSEMVFYPGKWQGMRIPIKLGHEHVGVIEEAGSEVKGWQVGDWLRHACGGRPLADCPRARRTGDRPCSGGAVAVRRSLRPLGGYLVRRQRVPDWLRLHGLAHDVRTGGQRGGGDYRGGHQPPSSAAGEGAGCNGRVEPERVDVVAETMRITEGRGVEVAIEATGKPEPLEIASRVLRKPRPKLVLIGWHNVPATYNLSH